MEGNDSIFCIYFNAPKNHKEIRQTAIKKSFCKKNTKLGVFQEKKK